MSTIALLFFPFAMAFAACSDLLTMRISNKLVLLLAAGFCVLAIVTGMSLQQFAMHVACAMLVLIVGFTFFAMRWIGGGDAKVIAAACLWLGLQGSGMFLLWTGMMGGVFCLILLFARFHSRPYLLGAPGWLVHLMEPKGDIPYGVAICAGALMAFPSSPLLAAFIAG